MSDFADDFARADSTDLGAGWAESSGDWSIISGQLSPGVDTGTVILTAAAVMDGSDHFAQVTIATPAAASMGVWCRGGPGSPGYLWRNDGSTWDLFRVVSGTFTLLDTYSVPAAPGDVAKVQAVGSTITGWVNGVQRVSVTDTGVATGTSVGLRSGTPSAGGGVRYDDFSAGDITSGATLGTAGEVDTAQPLTGNKTASLATASEQDTAQPLTGAKSATLGTAASTETALPLTGSKAATLGTATEVDTARPLTVAGSTVPSMARTYRIPAERRRLVVPAEDRTLRVRR